MATSLALDTVLAKSARNTFSSSRFVRETKASALGESFFHKERTIGTVAIDNGRFRDADHLKLHSGLSFCSMIFTEMFISRSALVR